jgi:hypothetical protein
VSRSLVAGEINASLKIYFLVCNISKKVYIHREDLVKKNENLFLSRLGFECPAICV